MNRHLFVGLTGGIGSGKSTAARYFKELGAEVLDADEISKTALAFNGPCVKKTVEQFGRSILNDDGSINRKALADIIFNDESKRFALNQIIHPFVVHELLRLAYASNRHIIVFDVPLLYECGLDKQMDVIISVITERYERIRRVIERNHLTLEEVEKRLSAQEKMEKRFLEADYTLDNNGNSEDLMKQVRELYRIISNKLQ